MRIINSSIRFLIRHVCILLIYHTAYGQQQQLYDWHVNYFGAKTNGINMRSTWTDSTISFICAGDSIMYGSIEPLTGKFSWVKAYSVFGSKDWNVRISNLTTNQKLIHSFEDGYNGTKTHITKVDLNGNVEQSISIAPKLNVEKLWADTLGNIHVLGGDSTQYGYYLRLDSNLNIMSKLKVDSVKLCDIQQYKSDNILLGWNASNRVWVQGSLTAIKLDTSDNVLSAKYYPTQSSISDTRISHIQHDSSCITVFIANLNSISFCYSTNWVNIDMNDLHSNLGNYWGEIGILNTRKITDSTAILIGCLSRNGCLYFEDPIFQKVKITVPFELDTGFALDYNGYGSYLENVYPTDGGYVIQGAMNMFDGLFYGMPDNYKTNCTKYPFNIDTALTTITDSSYTANFSTLNLQKTVDSISTSSCWIYTGPYCSTVSVEEHTMKELKLYPNPTSGKIIVEIPGKNLKCKLQAYNSLGAIVLDQIVYDGKNTIDLRNELPGIYLVKLHIGTDVSVRKVVVNSR